MPRARSDLSPDSPASANYDAFPISNQGERTPTSVAGGFVRGLLRSRGPDAAYRAYLNRCLREFGYEPIGWR